MAVISPRSRSGQPDKRLPVAVCVLVFLVLCFVNSLLSDGEVGSFLYEAERIDATLQQQEEGQPNNDGDEEEEDIQQQPRRRHIVGSKEERLPPLNKKISSTTTKSDINAPISLTSQALRFYENHQRAMQTLINETSIMDWNRDRRKKGKYRRWLDAFDYFEIKGKSTNLADAQGYDFIYQKDDLCLVAQLFHQYRQQRSSPLPHVLLLRYNQDFGGLSSDLGGLNRPMRNLPKLWKKQGCTQEQIMDYVNHPETLAIFTNQFQMVHHDKIISIPLGLSGSPPDLLLSQIQQTSTANRTQLFMLNTNVQQKRSRAQDVATLIHNFQGGIQNTYPIYTAMAKGSFASNAARTLYYQEMLKSQFVWSPPGLGLDCYRHWESLYLGAIPVLRHDHRQDQDGWLAHVLDDLPVAWMDTYDQLTPEYLQAQYQRIVQKWETYDYRKLTRQYWIDLAYSYVNKHKNQAQGLSEQ